MQIIRHLKSDDPSAPQVVLHNYRLQLSLRISAHEMNAPAIKIN